MNVFNGTCVEGGISMPVNRNDLEIIIKTEWCKGCGICEAFCPKKILKVNAYEKIEIVNREACIKCGQCELRCPDFAISLGGKE